MNIKNLLKWGREILRDSVTADLDVELILARVMGERREYLYMWPQREVSAERELRFVDFLERARRGEPVAYILEEKEFFGRGFFVDKRVLVPRPETEFLVEWAKANLRPRRILDVGTGSGNLAVTLALEFLEAEVFALDLSAEATSVAHINAERYGVLGRLKIRQSDLLEVILAGEKFDLIVANLPYIGRKQHNFVAENAVLFEPDEALFGGEDGLQLYRRMFEEMREKKIEFGVLIGEFGFSQAGDLSEILDEYFANSWEIRQDLAGLDRYFIVNQNA